MSRIQIIGGGPAGLYLAYLLKKSKPSRQVQVVEQNSRDATYGFGVVFGSGVLERLMATEDACTAEIAAAAQSWSGQTITVGADSVFIDGGGFSGIARLTLLQILQRYCENVGVQLRFTSRITDVAALARDCDLLVGADGVNSVVRQAFGQQLGAHSRVLGNRFAWYGVERPFETHALAFRRVQEGAFVAHYYRYTPTHSTFLVECDRDTWDGKLAELTEDERRAVAARIFERELDGRALLSNNSVWRSFVASWTDRWSIGNVTLLGDALRSAHFSIGSGTRLAMRDASELARAMDDCDDHVTGALEAYESQRRPGREAFADAAEKSFLWYEDFAARLQQPALDFTHDYLVRTGRMNAGRLRQESPLFMQRYEAYRNECAAPVVRAFSED